MDKKRAISISKKFLEKISSKNYNISQVWIFGSVIKGFAGEDSDIDLAIFLRDNSKTFDKEVELMSLRHGDEIAIEPHLFNYDDFTSESPLINQIQKTGIKIH